MAEEGAMTALADMLNPDPTLDLFERAYQPQWRAWLWRMVGRRPSELLELSSLARGWRIRSRHFAGQQMVPLSQIRGSESRASDFDGAFRPRARHIAERWRRVAEAWLKGTSLPPVELIRVGELYFVQDGHHRISVAKQFEVGEVEALVTVWEVARPGPWEQPAVTMPT
jgi:hypothetical protein